jgi:hypothetical protein
VLRHCMFAPFYFDSIRNAFQLVQKEVVGGGNRAQPLAAGGARRSPQDLAVHAGASIMGRTEGPVVSMM